MSKEDEEAEQKLWRELVRERAQLGKECMGDDLSENPDGVKKH